MADVQTISAIVKKHVLTYNGFGLISSAKPGIRMFLCISHGDSIHYYEKSYIREVIYEGFDVEVEEQSYTALTGELPIHMPWRDIRFVIRFTTTNGAIVNLRCRYLNAMQQALMGYVATTGNYDNLPCTGECLSTSSKEVFDELFYNDKCDTQDVKNLVIYFTSKESVFREYLRDNSILHRTLVGEDDEAKLINKLRKIVENNHRPNYAKVYGETLMNVYSKTLSPSLAYI